MNSTHVLNPFPASRGENSFLQQLRRLQITCCDGESDKPNSGIAWLAAGSVWTICKMQCQWPCGMPVDITFKQLQWVPKWQDRKRKRECAKIFILTVPFLKFLPQSFQSFCLPVYHFADVKTVFASNARQWLTDNYLFGEFYGSRNTQHNCTTWPSVQRITNYVILRLIFYKLNLMCNIELCISYVLFSLKYFLFSEKNEGHL